MVCMNMKNKKIMILVGAIVVLAIVIIGFITKTVLENGKSINIELDQKNFLGAVEIKSDADFILLINENEKVSNIIFLNEESVSLLSDKRIEGRSIEQAIKKIVDIMKNNNSFEKSNELLLVDYENSSLYTTVKNELNKELVVYGVDKQIAESSNNLQKKLEELNIKKQSNDESSLEQLYYYSQELLQKNSKK